MRLDGKPFSTTRRLNSRNSANLIAERIEKTKAVRVAIDSLLNFVTSPKKNRIYRLQMETLKPISGERSHNINAR